MEVIRNRRCINCTITLTHLRSRSLRDATVPIMTILRSWVSPTPVSHEDYLCLECFIMIQDIPLLESLPSPKFGHRNVCVGCGLSILRARTHQVAPNNPEWNIILKWTFPHMVSQLQKVCKACWMAATRTVQRQMHHDSNREIHTLPLDTEEMNTSTSDNIPLPPPLPQQPLFTLPTEREQLKIISSTHRRAASTTRRCLFPNCRNVERLLVPAEIKNMLLSRYIGATDNKAVAICAFGEGWHNYHHVFPWDYKAAELGNYSTNMSTALIDIAAQYGLAYDLKTVSQEMIRKRVARTGDGTHPSNEQSKKSDEDHNHPENPVWGWDDEDMTEEERKLAEIAHKLE